MGRETREDVVAAVEAAAVSVCPDFDVVVAYLYGSYVRGDEHGDSDVDVAVLFGDGDLQALLALGRRMQAEAGIRQEIDVRRLDGADLSFQHNVIREGTVLYEGDADRRAAFERSVYNRYLDLKPYIQQYHRLRGDRIAEALP